MANFTAKAYTAQYGRRAQKKGDLGHIPYPSPRAGDGLTAFITAQYHITIFLHAAGSMQFLEVSGSTDKMPSNVHDWQMPCVAAEKIGSSARESRHAETEAACDVPSVDWARLEKHGCLVREDICIDQVRLRLTD